MDLLFPLLPILIIAVVIYAQHHQRQALTARWRALAATSGLTFQSGRFLRSPRISGQLYGTEVVVDSIHRTKDRSKYTRATATPALALPANLHITPEGVGSTVAKLAGGQDIEINDAALDERARIRADNPEDVQALFADALLTSACLTLFSTSSHNRIEGGTVIIEKRIYEDEEEEEDVELMLEVAASLAASFTAARLRPWQQLAKTHGLDLNTRPSQIRLSGTINGLSLAAVADPAAGHSRISVRVPADLPPALEIVSGRSPDAITLDDPILDSTITASGAPPAALAALLRGDDLRGELLSVLHAFPGSSVHSGFVHLVLPYASALDLSDRVEDACRLARALATRAPEPEPERQPMRKAQRQKN